MPLWSAGEDVVCQIVHSCPLSSLTRVLICTPTAAAALACCDQLLLVGTAQECCLMTAVHIISCCEDERQQGPVSMSFTRCCPLWPAKLAGCLVAVARRTCTGCQCFNPTVSLHEVQQVHSQQERQEPNESQLLQLCRGLLLLGVCGQQPCISKPFAHTEPQASQL